MEEEDAAAVAALDGKRSRRKKCNKIKGNIKVSPVDILSFNGLFQDSGCGKEKQTPVISLLFDRLERKDSSHSGPFATRFYHPSSIVWCSSTTSDSIRSSIAPSNWFHFLAVKSFVFGPPPPSTSQTSRISSAGNACPPPTPIIRIYLIYNFLLRFFFIADLFFYPCTSWKTFLKPYDMFTAQLHRTNPYAAAALNIEFISSHPDHSHIRLCVFGKGKIKALWRNFQRFENKSPVVVGSHSTGGGWVGAWW